MTFSTDRDLLAIEPNLFSEVAFASQKRLDVSDGVVTGSTLSSAGGNFTNAQIGAGDVVLIATAPCEVLARVDDHTLTVSKLRGNLADAAIPPGNGSSLAVVARTFEPQAALVHAMLLQRLGVDPDDAEAAVTEDAIVSLGVMSRLEVLGTLAQVYTAAAALGEDNADIRLKANDYQRRFELACRAAIVQLDLDGDGKADTARHLGVIELTRM